MTLKSTGNARVVPWDAVPVSAWEALRRSILFSVGGGKRIAALFGLERDGLSIVAVLADDKAGKLWIGRAPIEGNTFEALTPECPQAHWFEREIAEQWAVVPEGHPWQKPIRFHAPLRSGHENDAHPVVGVTSFFRVEGEQVHEVAVGPVHAGVIEPGHFRFQCHGEHVFHLEISLGYQHRGIERALAGGPHKRTLAQMETAAGDTSIGHALAYAHALEALSGTTVPARAHALRGVALELERLASHTGDLGALAGDVGYLPTMSYCGRIRGDFLNLTAVLCGSRFGRGMVKPGGVRFDVDEDRKNRMLERLEQARADVTNAVELLWETPSVMARFEGTGIVSREDCEALGLVGPAARACGIDRDLRQDHPRGVYRTSAVPVMTAMRGDVYSRAFVRWLEMQQSVELIDELLGAMPEGASIVPMKPLAPDSLVVSMIEGWRGEICHVAITDREGRFARYKIVDPSFHNWIGLAMALRNEQISDFPLCNKSFNLSYCGHDL